MAYKYDPKTGKWTRTDSGGGSGGSSGGSSRGGNSSGGKTNNGGGSNGNLISSNPDKNTSTGSTEKKYNTIEINTLQGTLQFIATPTTIKLTAGDTVKILGIGKYLSGNYYVQDVTRNISTNGYSHSATLIKTDFGDSLKKKATPKKPAPTPKKKVKSPKKPKKKPTRTYTVKAGDCLWSIASRMYGSGTQWKKIYNANTDKCGKPYTRGGTTHVLIYPGQVLTIP